MPLDGLRRLAARPGVYLLLDLDGNPLYVGKSRELKTRLAQRFFRQDSSVTSDGLLDVYDVWRVLGWYVDVPDSLDGTEALLFTHFTPRFNRLKPKAGAVELPLDLEAPDFDVALVEEPELGHRRQSLARIENKLLHLLRATRKARISGASPGSSRHLLCMRLSSMTSLASCSLRRSRMTASKRAVHV